MTLRLIRVNELLKRVLGDFLCKCRTREVVSLTFTRVHVSDDLKVADVYFSTYPEDHKDQALQWLIKIRKQLQMVISKEVRLKRTPRIMFVWDAELQKAHRTFALLREVDESLATRKASSLPS